MNDSMQQTAGADLTTRTHADRPCPPWCTLPAGHHWDSALTKRGATYAQRFHVAGRTDIAVPGRDRVTVAVQAGETVRATLDCRPLAGAASTTQAASVCVHWPDGPLDRTPAQTRALARKLSAALEAAAAELERITG